MEVISLPCAQRLPCYNTCSFPCLLITTKLANKSEHGLTPGILYANLKNNVPQNNVFGGEGVDLVDNLISTFYSV